LGVDALSLFELCVDPLKKHFRLKQTLPQNFYRLLRRGARFLDIPAPEILKSVLTLGLTSDEAPIDT
jgi:hypothetical protein